MAQLVKAVLKRFGCAAGDVLDGDAAACQDKNAHGGGS
ncbi:Bacteriophage tail assembly protein-like protein [Comamonas thiooxydans]|nr:Bacteriophage tail assembly protein-like protein [Comamonas thiooxydans]